MGHWEGILLHEQLDQLYIYILHDELIKSIHYNGMLLKLLRIQQIGPNSTTLHVHVSF